MPIIRFRVQQLRILKKWAPSAAAVLPWPLTRWLLVNEQRSRRADKTLSAVLMNAEIPPAAARRSFSYAPAVVLLASVCACALGQNSLMNFPEHILLSEKCTWIWSLFWSSRVQVALRRHFPTINVLVHWQITPRNCIWLVLKDS